MEQKGLETYKICLFFGVKNEKFPWGANPAVKQTTRKDRVFSFPNPLAPGCDIQVHVSWVGEPDFHTQAPSGSHF